MRNRKSIFFKFQGLAIVLVAIILTTSCNNEPKNVVSAPKAINPLENRMIPHLDHTAYYPDSISSPQELTKSCLECHPNSAKEVMKTPHWTFLSGDVERNGEHIRIGKKNQINNFCISIVGNWARCTKCHAGYGWTDENFDFTAEENVDCLACHDGSGTYVKDTSGVPMKGVNLQVAAQSVSRPKNDNCGACHFNGGGGMGVKHGDLDESLLNPNEELDVHIGKLNFQCVDCHTTEHHLVSGKVNNTYTERTTSKRFDCEKCHTDKPHTDGRLNIHTERIECQTCHIPEYARKLPTKMTWDWGKAGDSTREENVHEYLKIKGEFTYEKNVIPTYAWFNHKMDRYILGDPVDPETENLINKPLGSRDDKKSKIHPFKVHISKQPYDEVNKYLIPPLTSGKGGFWNEFDWPSAIRKGAEFNNLPFSGECDFIETKMYWPINHMVTTKDNALKCTDCHSENSRMDWKALGYGEDPIKHSNKQLN
ncbi:MAG: cytochrome C [Salinivirgaceae bacterium]|nr:MAG: cytochrome C [Salinivirgaceae bacterium]